MIVIGRGVERADAGAVRAPGGRASADGRNAFQLSLALDLAHDAANDPAKTGSDRLQRRLAAILLRLDMAELLGWLVAADVETDRYFPILSSSINCSYGGCDDLILSSCKRSKLLSCLQSFQRLRTGWGAERDSSTTSYHFR